MNQAIQFPDREWWDESVNAVCFPAQVNGFQVICAIGGESLFRRYGKEQTVLKIFCRYRWDLEDEAETVIRAEQEDNQGWIWLP